MAVAVRYTSGATLTYHLTAYAPWEGYRLMVNGSLGRLELEVTESSHVDPEHAATLKGVALQGGQTDPLGRLATQRDGALSLLTGLAANRSFETGLPVRVADLLRVP